MAHPPPTFSSTDVNANPATTDPSSPANSVYDLRYVNHNHKKYVRSSPQFYYRATETRFEPTTT